MDSKDGRIILEVIIALVLVWLFFSKFNLLSGGAGGSGGSGGSSAGGCGCGGGCGGGTATGTVPGCPAVAAPILSITPPLVGNFDTPLAPPVVPAQIYDNKGGGTVTGNGGTFI